MKRKMMVIVSAFFFNLAFAQAGFGTVEWDIQRTFKLEKAPLDVAVSAKGTWVFVLTEEGSILAYNAQGILKEKIEVGKHIDGIAAGPSEDILLVTSHKKKTVQQIRLDFIFNINVTGSPFKGPADAPVVIAVFNDFQ